MKDRKDLPQGYEAPFVPFPEKPKLVVKHGMLVYEYIPSGVFIRQLQEFCHTLDFSRFDAIAYNLNGGKFPANLMAEIKHYQGEMVPIRYHMDKKDGKGVNVVLPIPKDLRDKKVLVIEDVYDTGGVFKEMRKDCKGVSMAVMSLKVGVEDQIPPPSSVRAVFRTVNKWQAGMGMNIEYGDKDPYYREGAFRTYSGILIRPPKELLEALYEKLPKISVDMKSPL